MKPIKVLLADDHAIVRMGLASLLGTQSALFFLFQDLFVIIGGNPALVKKAAPLAIHAFHSSDDSAVPVEGSRTMVSAVKAAGGKRMRYTEYNYTGHGSWVAAAQTPGLLEWQFSQTREEC